MIQETLAHMIHPQLIEVIQRFCYVVNVDGVVEKFWFGRTWYFCLFVFQGEESVGPI